MNPEGESIKKPDDEDEDGSKDIDTEDIYSRICKASADRQGDNPVSRSLSVQHGKSQPLANRAVRRMPRQSAPHCLRQCIHQPSLVEAELMTITALNVPHVRF